MKRACDYGRIVQLPKLSFGWGEPGVFPSVFICVHLWPIVFWFSWLPGALSLSACREIDRVPKVDADIQSLKTALETYKQDTGSYPTAEQGLRALREKPEGVAKWTGRYINRDVPKDPWGHDYIYKYPGEVERQP